MTLMQDDFIPEEQVHMSDDEDFENDHQSKADLRKDWWKPLPIKERPATPKLTWSIPSSNKSDVEYNWASALATTYEPPADNSLLAKTNDMTTFMKWYCQQLNKIELTQADFEVQNMASLTGGLLDKSSILTDMILPHVAKIADHPEHTIAEKDFKNLYPSDFKDLNLLLLQGHLDHLFGSYKRMLSTAVKFWTRNLDATGYEFKHDYTIIESPRAVVFPVNNHEQKIMRFKEIYKFSDGTLTRILEALAYRVKEFKVNWFNPGMNTRFWTDKDVTRSNEFITAIERQLKTRRIYRNHHN
ncbi:hypothetical protein Tco_0084872 [Tanacetum coccineum]